MIEIAPTNGKTLLNRLILIFESSQKYDDLLKRNLNDLDNHFTLKIPLTIRDHIITNCETKIKNDVANIKLNIRPWFALKKSKCENIISGIDIAHQICTAAAKNIKNKNHEHYKSVFKSVEERYIEGFNIQNIRER